MSKLANSVELNLILLIEEKKQERESVAVCLLARRQKVQARISIDALM